MRGLSILQLGDASITHLLVGEYLCRQCVCWLDYRVAYRDEWCRGRCASSFLVDVVHNMMSSTDFLRDN
jgi:hypothetical protein